MRNFGPGRLSASDRSLIGDLYERYYDLLLREAKKIVHNRYDAEDVVQDFFVYALSHVDKIRGIDRSMTGRFLLLCIRRKSIDALRRRETRKKYIVDLTEDSVFAYADQRAAVEESVLNRIAIEEVKEILNRLPENQQRVMEYRYFRDMTDREIGRILRIRPSSVRSCLTRARKTVNRIDSKNGYTGS